MSLPELNASQWCQGKRMADDDNAGSVSAIPAMPLDVSETLNQRNWAGEGSGVAVAL